MDRMHKIDDRNFFYPVHPVYPCFILLSLDLDGKKGKGKNLRISLLSLLPFAFLLLPDDGLIVARQQISRITVDRDAACVAQFLFGKASAKHAYCPKI